MNIPANASPVRTAVEIAVNLLLIFVILYMCLQILAPFITIIIWAAVIATATYVPFVKLVGLLGGGKKLALLIFAVIGLSIVIVPASIFVGSILDDARALNHSLEAGEIDVPPPNESVKDWPLVGNTVYTNWSEAAVDLELWLEQNREMVRSVAGGLLSKVAHISLSVLQLVISTLIALAFLGSADTLVGGSRILFARLMGPEQGDDLLKLSSATVTSVTIGVLGISFIQALLGGVGMMVVGVPAAGLLTLLLFIICVAQLPPWLLMFPVIAYVFSVESTTVAAVFAVWGVIVSFLDMALKPILMGRGVDAPMLVILLGAIGGLVVLGFIGLFIGAIVLALGYKLLQAWLAMPHEDDPTEPVEAS